jgi:hypothetical protein
VKLPNSLFTLLIVATVLFSVGFACNDSKSGTTAESNTTGTKPNAPITSSKKTDIIGKYDATGANPDGGGQYKADLTVTPRDDVYQFSWVSGTTSYDGVGVLTDGEVAVAYTDGDNGKGCGVVLYKINSDGSLEGKKGYWGVNTMETETATRTKGSGSDLDGVYDIAGKNPQGGKYKGSLTVAKSGEGYSFDWDAGNKFSGFGIKAGSFVAVGFGGRQCSFVGYDVQSDGTLEGKWGNQVSKNFGTETAKPKK